MMHLKKFTVLAALVGLCGASNLRAEMASGGYTNTFSYTNVPIWDISGTYGADVSGSGFDFTINMDRSGNFNGKGSIAMAGLTNVDLAFFGNVRNGASNVTRVNIGLRLKGKMDLGTQGGVMSFHATVIEKLEVDAATGTLIGTMGGAAGASFMGHTVSERIPPTNVVMNLPVGVTGTWQLALDVQTNRNHYTGAGTVTLSNGRTIPVVANGSYAPRTDISRLVIHTAPGTTNGIVNLGLTSTVAGGEIQIQRLIGRALGQTLRSVAP
jgi:hypothetical protein